MKRRLSGEEAALWARLAQTVTPMRGRIKPRAEPVPATPGDNLSKRDRVVSPAPAAPQIQTVAASAPVRPLDLHGLDGGWERRLAKGLAQPDFTLDLHGASLDAAHSRLDHGLSLALAQGARVLLLITGRARPADESTHRGERRGAIRAKAMDWIAAGPHASRIAAVRPAHPRHGGAGALYIVLKRAR